MALQQGGPEKADEFLWGGMAEPVKAVATLSGIQLRNHGFPHRYARGLARERNDPEFEAAFIRAEPLHSNYYEAFLSREEREREFEALATAVSKLMKLLPEGASA